MKFTYRNSVLKLIALLALMFAASTPAKVAQFIDDSGEQIISTASEVAYQWDTVDIASPVITLQNDTKLVVNSAGVYQITYAINWRTNDPNGADARRQIRTFVRKNGEPLAMAQSHGYARIENQAENATNAATFYVELDSGDYLELYHINESSNLGDAISNPGQSWFALGLIEAVDPLQQQLGDGLVAYLPFNGNASDESSYGNHGTVLGPVLAADRFGNPDSAFLFDGVDDYIEIANSPSLNPTNQITLSAWYRVDSRFSGNGANAIINKYHSFANVPPGYQYSLQIVGHDYPNYPGAIAMVASTSNTAYSSVGFSMLPLGQWVHFVGVYDGTLNKLFINGSLVDSSLQNGIIDNFGNPVWIGRNTGSFSQFTPGLIDDLRIYNRALSDAEVQSLYNLESNNN